MNDLTEIGPVQLTQVGFGPGANFEGRIADELARLEKDGRSGCSTFFSSPRTPTPESW